MMTGGGMGCGCCGKLFADDDTTALSLDTPARDGIERGRPQRLARGQVEARMMQRAPNGVADDEPLGEGAAIMGAVRADREDAVASADQHDVVFTHLAGKRLAVA